jgi:hypothetical protein
MKPIAVLTIVASLAALAAADARAAPRRPGQGVVAAPAKVVSSPLTTGECTGLGGKLIDLAVGATVCNKAGGGQICVTVDKNGVVHAACITSK